MLYLTPNTDVTPPHGLNGLVAHPKRFELPTPDLRLVPMSEIRTILISDFCSESKADLGGAGSRRP